MFPGAPTQLPPSAVSFMGAGRSPVAGAAVPFITALVERPVEPLQRPIHPHVSDYLSDDETKRELPAKYIKAFEAVCGNSAISQWLAAQSKLTVLEEMQAERRTAA